MKSWSTNVLAAAWVVGLAAAPSAIAVSYTIETPYGLGDGMHWDEYQWHYQSANGLVQDTYSYGNTAWLPTPFTVQADTGSIGDVVGVEVVIELSVIRMLPQWFTPSPDELANFTGFGLVQMRVEFNGYRDSSSYPPAETFVLSGGAQQIGDTLLGTVRWTVPVQAGVPQTVGVAPAHVEFSFTDPTVADPAQNAVCLLAGFAYARVADVRLASVPDGGSTLGMALLACGLLLGWQRKQGVVS